jgi:hypothetical protein
MMKEKPPKEQTMKKKKVGLIINPVAGSPRL